MKQSTIAVVGAGVVGSTTAYTLIMHNLASHILLVDVNDSKCRGEVLDLSDVLSFSSTATIETGSLSQAGQADIAIIAAGIAQKPGQTRAELLEENHRIIRTVIEGMKPLRKDLIIIVVTNPVDVLTSVAQQASGLPHQQVFGSGTMLDTQRLRHMIGSACAVAEESVHVHVLGEHADSQVVAWSSACIAGTPLLEMKGITADMLESWAKQTRAKAYEIIACKGSTAFGVAACVAAYCTNILFDTHRITTVSTYVERYGLYMSCPATLTAQGVGARFLPPLSPIEKDALDRSAQVIKDALIAIGAR